MYTPYAYNHRWFIIIWRRGGEEHKIFYIFSSDNENLSISETENLFFEVYLYNSFFGWEYFESLINLHETGYGPVIYKES